MKFPMLAILIYYIVGIFTGITFQDDLVSTSLFSVAVFITIVMLCKFYKWTSIYFLILIYFLGIYLTLFWIKVPTPDNTDVTLEGIVVSSKKTNSGNNKIYLNTSDGYKIYIIDTKDNNINLSDIITIRGQLLPLEKSINYYDYNEFLYERTLGVSYKMFPKEVKIIGFSKNLRYYLNQLRIKVSYNYDKIFSLSKASIVKAVTIGDKDDFDPEVAQLFKIGGIYHILAISGLHITLIATVLFKLMEKIFKNKFSNIITIVFLILYGIFTGLSISTVRAIFMCSVFLLATIFYRKNHGLNSLFVSAFVLLLIQPLYLFQVGFLLSYFAVVGILVLSPTLITFSNHIVFKIDNTNLTGINRVLAPYISPTVGAFLFTLPIICWFFYTIYPYTIIVNFLIGFTIPIFVLLSFLVGIISLISIDIGVFFSHSVSFLIDIYYKLCELVATLPYNSILIGRTSFWFNFLYYISLFSIFFYFNKRKIIYKHVGIFTFVSIFLFYLYFNFFNNSTTLTFLNNNSNDSIIINNQNNYIFIEHNGDSRHIDNYFNYKGIDKIELSIIPQLSVNNITTTLDLMEQKKVSHVIINDTNISNNEAYHILKNSSIKNNIPLTILKNNDKAYFNKIELFFNAKNLIMVYNKVDFCYILEDNINKSFDIIVYDSPLNSLDNIDFEVLISRNIDNYHYTTFLKKDKDFTFYLSDDKIKFKGD